MFPLAVMCPLNLCVSIIASPNIFEPSVTIVDEVIKEDVKCVTSIAFENIVPLALMSPYQHSHWNQFLIFQYQFHQVL